MNPLLKIFSSSLNDIDFRLLLKNAEGCEKTLYPVALSLFGHYTGETKSESPVYIMENYLEPVSRPLIHVNFFELLQTCSCLFSICLILFGFSVLTYSNVDPLKHDKFQLLKGLGTNAC